MSRNTFYIPVADYEVVADLYEPKSKPLGALLWLLGKNSARSTDIEARMRVAEKAGYSMLVFDYSGHGDSPYVFEETTQRQHLKEVTAVFDWLQVKIKNTPIAVCGGSYGGFLAALLTQQRRFEQLILRAPAIYQPDIFEQPWGAYDERATGLYRRNTNALNLHPLFMQLHSYRGRALIMQHEFDDICPDMVIRAYRHALPKADFYLAKNVSHSLAGAEPETVQAYEQQLCHWLSK